MTRLVALAADRARMVMAFIVLSIIAGAVAYVGLPKEGEPDIEVPYLFVSVPFPGISATDAESLLVKPMETELSRLDGLLEMTTTAAEGYAGALLKFDFNWDKTATIANVRDAMNTAESRFPAGADKYLVNEINFSEFPITIVNLSGDVPERTLIRVAQSMQDRLEGIEGVLETQIAGYRKEMLEVVIGPTRLEAYNVTANELISVVRNNNKLIAAGAIDTATGSVSVKIPSSFDNIQDVYALPVKVNGDRVVTLGDLADIRLTFADRTGTARYNGQSTVALQVVKAKGYNLIDTAQAVRAAVAEEVATWPEPLRQSVHAAITNDQSFIVDSMVNQLESSVVTAIALVMIVVLASLGLRSALLVGFAIPTSFLLTFALLGALDVTISNIVMFGLILAVGMLVDGAIVVVEYADKRIAEGAGPMRAYVEAAQRMFWPIVSSTATTLAAFLPMIFWPGIAGEFMGMLPRTLIYVLSASLLVALIYLPVVGGLAGRWSRALERASGLLRPLPWVLRALIIVALIGAVFVSAMQMINPDYLLPLGGLSPAWAGTLVGVVLFLIATALLTIAIDSIKIHRQPERVEAGYRRSAFGWVVHAITSNPVMPLIAIFVVIGVVVLVFKTYGEHNYGVEFFAQTEPDQAIIYVEERGNLSLEEKDALVARAERVALETPGIKSVFAFAGQGGLNQNTGGGTAPRDAIGRVQIEMVRWEDRPHITETIKLFGILPFKREVIDPRYDGNTVMAELEKRLSQVPALRFEVLNLARGPASAKPVHLRIEGRDWDKLLAATRKVREHFEQMPGLVGVDDTLPLPGIDWQLTVDVEAAGRYGTDVATVGGAVQLVTNGLLLDTMRVDSSEEEIDIRVRVPRDDRVLATLESFKLRTPKGLVPLSNFVTWKAVPTLAQINRTQGMRYFDVKAGVASDLVALTGPDGKTRYVTAAEADQITQVARPGEWTQKPINATERTAEISKWLESGVLGPGISWAWTGDQQDQADSQAFLMKAFVASLFLMFVILLAQFNSFYNAVLVLLAVVLSTTGVLVGMLVMKQPFSVIMTGTGVLALAGIVVNNNIVLIDTYQEFSRTMPRLQAITRTAEARIRPVLLTTITTMAGLMPMMFGLSLDFFNGGYSINAPTALWWKQLATAVVFGLGIATVLTLIFTPAMLALRVWIEAGAYRSLLGLQALLGGRGSRAARDRALQRAARRQPAPEIVWPLPEQDGSAGADEGEPAPELNDLERVLARTRAAETGEAEESTEARKKSAPAPDSGEPQANEGDGAGGPLKAAE